jgi:hypothetical protein
MDDVRKDLTDLFNKAIDDVRLNLSTSLRGFDERIDSIESNMIKRHDDLIATVDAKIADLQEVHRAASDLAASKIVFLENSMREQKTQYDDLLERFKKGDAIARKAARDAIRAANAVEGHNRRWALRILGLPAPDSHETTHQAK